MFYPLTGRGGILVKTEYDIKKKKGWATKHIVMAYTQRVGAPLGL